ncbi:hypothetical protein C0J52_16325 [Blattella germanica]|nr:hypothetical protein C0J52_16325 [Blattella germanica]
MMSLQPSTIQFHTSYLQEEQKYFVQRPSLQLESRNIIVGHACLDNNTHAPKDLIIYNYIQSNYLNFLIYY